MNIKEVAKSIGVSSATVSRVINNSGYVSAETREKVLKGIEKYNYVPNAVARSLSIRRSSYIGVIIPDIQNEFFSSVIQGISEVAKENNCYIQFMSTNENTQLEHEFLKIVESYQLAGIIIAPVSEDDEWTREQLLRMNHRKIPIILVDRDIRNTNFDGVFVDNEKGSYEAVKSLIREGHKKIATIAGSITSKPGKERLEGYLNALKDNHIPVIENYIAYGNFKIDRAYQCAKALLSQDDPPTAIFTSNNLTTIGCLKYFTENKIKLGRDISLIGFDDIEVFCHIGFPLSVIARDAKLQGKRAMELMIRRWDESFQQEVTRENVPHRLILRGSEKLIGK